MRSLFVMDPLDRIDVAGDSTYVTMRACTERGQPTWMCTPDDLYAEKGRVFARAVAVRTTADAPYFHVSNAQVLDLEALDVVWMRKDPPYDIHYVFAAWLLDMVADQTLVVNDPVGLLRFNEKLWAMRFPDLHPPTLLTRDIEGVRAFIEAQPGRVVVKPWHGSGGHGVIVTEGGDRNLGSILELLTHEGREHIVAQPFLEGVEEGDKRILLIEGEPAGALLRVPTARDYRGNMHAGARVRRCELDDRDVEICRVLGPALKKHGLLFVGIDIIEGYLTEINVTSPTGIREINRLYDVALEQTLLDAVQSAVEHPRVRP